MARSRHERGRRRPRGFVAPDEKRIEHQRRRQRLKREPFGEETKRERFYERYDKWAWV